MSFRDNTEKQRFELDIDGAVAFAEYRDREGARALTHFETPEKHRGKGAAGRLMRAILDHARAQQMQLKARCPYAVDYLERNPSAGDVLS
jgi:predicted GNAT family acetyltransferase